MLIVSVTVLLLFGTFFVPVCGFIDAYDRAEASFPIRKVFLSVYGLVPESVGFSSFGAFWKTPGVTCLFPPPTGLIGVVLFVLLEGSPVHRAAAPSDSLFRI